MQTCEVEKTEKSNNNIYEPTQSLEKKSYMEKLRWEFFDIPEEIELKFKNTKEAGNSWLDCLIDKVTAIKSLTELAYEDKKRGEIRENRYFFMKKKINELIDEVKRRRNDDIADNTKQELLNLLTWEKIFGSMADELQMAFERVEIQIEEELNRPYELDESKRNKDNQNNWLYCFSSRVSEISGLICLTKKELGQAEKERADKQINLLHERTTKLNMIYPGKDAEIPKWIQEKLLTFLTWYNIIENTKNTIEETTEIGKIEDEILDVQKTIKEKMGNAPEKNWLHCFNSVVGKISQNFSLEPVKQELGKEKCESVGQKFGELISTAEILSEKYERGNQPMQEKEQHELLRGLNASIDFPR